MAWLYNDFTYKAIFSGRNPETLYGDIFRSIDANQDKFVARLAEAVAIPSISAEPAHRNDIVTMVHWTKKHLEALGVRTELVDAGIQENSDGLPLPPVLFGTLGSAPKRDKKTLLVYGHLDVQPAQKEEGWDTDPFPLTEKDGKLHGRGSTNGKGPMFGWINAIETLQKLRIDLPVNIKFCLEGMGESGSQGLVDVLKRRSADFFHDVDYICIPGNYCWATDFKSPNFRAGDCAIKKVFGVEHDMTRVGGSIPIALTFQELTGKSVLLLPMGACDDRENSQNEKMNRSNYIKGTKMLASYIVELSG